MTLVMTKAVLSGKFLSSLSVMELLAVLVSFLLL